MLNIFLQNCFIRGRLRHYSDIFFGRKGTIIFRFDSIKVQAKTLNYRNVNKCDQWCRFYNSPKNVLSKSIVVSFNLIENEKDDNMFTHAYLLQLKKS